MAFLQTLDKTVIDPKADVRRTVALGDDAVNVVESSDVSQEMTIVGHSSLTYSFPVYSLYKRIKSNIKNR